MKVIDPGHRYALRQIGSDEPVELVFLKRSGRLIQHGTEHPGLQVQEVLRALIDRTEYLDDLIPCIESQDAAWHLRMALFNYEARAFRRKQEKVNRQDGTHDDEARPRPWRTQPLEDVPFNEDAIERRMVGEDGHIVCSGAPSGH